MNSFLKKTLIFVAVLAIVASAGWFGRKAYKKSAEHRLILQAHQYLEQKDLRNTALCLQRAMQINPLSIEASQMMAELLEAANAPGALSWRMRVAKLQPDNVTNLFLWARAALEAKDFPSATEALAGVKDQAKTTADYSKLAGVLAWNTGKFPEAEKHYQEALRLEPANAANLLNLAIIHLASTNKTIADAARLSLEQVATNPPLRLLALRQLQQDAITRKSMFKAISYSTKIVSAPGANFGDKINFLQLLRETQSSDYVPVTAALKQAAANSPANAFALGRWLVTAEGPGPALLWLRGLSPGMQTNQPVPLIITDCEIALKDWKGLLALVSKQNWGEAEFYRLAVESLAQRSLGQTAAAENAWRKALRLTTHQLDRLTRLAQVASTWGWLPEKTEVLRQITDEFPKEKWAVDQLMAQLYVEGKTREMQELLVKFQADDPADARLKNNLANVFLLRKSELDKAYRLSKEAYGTLPGDPFIISTYAYSLLMQDKAGEALNVLNGLKSEYLQIPSVAAYYGVIQAQAGHKDIAQTSLARAETAKLLPEEKELIRLAKARL